MVSGSGLGDMLQHTFLKGAHVRSGQKRTYAVQKIWSLVGVFCYLGLGSHVGPQGYALNFAVSFRRFRRHVGEVKVVLCLSLMMQRRGAETHLIPLSHTRSCQHSPLHGGDDLLSVGSLFGYRPVSQFAVELANRFVDDPCFDFVDHVATNFVRPSFWISLRPQAHVEHCTAA